MTRLLRPAALGAGLTALTWAQRQAQWTPPTSARTVLFSILPIAVVVALFAVAVDRRRWIVAAGVVAAVSPSVLGQFGAAQRHGLLAVAAVAMASTLGPISRRSAMAAAVPAAALSAVGLASWWSVTPERLDGPDPNWSNLANSVGSWVERSTGGLGVDNLPTPMSGILVWWFAVGLIAGAAALSGRWRLALVPVAGLLVVIVGSAALERWKGPVNPVGGVWIVSGTVAFAATRAELPRRAAGRLAAAVGVLVAWSWWSAVAAQIRFVAIDDVLPASWARWHEWSSATGGATASTVLPIAAVGAIGAAAACWGLTAGSRDPRGVNVVGYHSITGGLGERTRELVSCLAAADVPVAAFDLDVDSERETAVLPSPERRYDTTIVVTPAFEVEQVAAVHPDVFRDRRLVAGYWFWELDRIPDSHRGGLERVDEVWAPTRFVRDAYRLATALPVRHVPLPVPEPEVAPIGREQLGLGSDDLVFLVSFSHLSVMERKNPVDAISAFVAAFPPDDDGADSKRLVIKTLNGDRRPDDADRLRTAAAVDGRIEIRDGRVEHAELMALVRAADVFVSLHRSEGLGLQIADAMWLGTPVIATDYSGTRDLLDHGLAELVPWQPAPVRHGDGAYPGSASWAQPDLHAASMSMRRLALDADRRHRLAVAARRRIAAQPERAAAGRTLAKLAGCR